ncbi:MAG: flagellar hook-associated protein FlgK [Melioribacteraceae bacterium]|jgi:flagellar hook-associated protein 1 FlgK|nr:flagellar hook-associated protein FlgK [Melioribacteraceae bacterium]
MALSRLFDISSRSMATYQRAMDVSSNNIANASNPDYTRQRAVISTENTQQYAGITWGSGVKLDDIERIRSSLTESQIISNNQKHAYNERSSVLLGQVEEVFSEPSELGISSLMGQFFSSWSELSANPTSSALRGNVVYSAQNLSAKVEDINESFQIIKTSIYHEFGDKVREVNNLLSGIQSINRQVSESVAIGQNANDLLDKRDTLIDDLSKLANITVNYESDQTANISIGGVFAVDKGSYTEFEMSNTEGNIAMVPVGETKQVVLTGGEMGALVDTFSNKIPAYQDKLDSVVNQLMTSVNSIHNTGYNVADPPQRGFDFFESYENGVLKITDEIKNDYNNIAISSDGTSGNGDIAISIFEISDDKVLNGSKLIDVYSTLISEVGSQKQNADRMAESGSIVLQQLNNQKDSYSAVSVDEEMLDVIKFQKAYEASAKLIRMADEMLETLMQLV